MEGERIVEVSPSTVPDGVEVLDLGDVTAIEQVRFVVEGGTVHRND